MRRHVTFAPGEYYHLFGRGNNRQKIVRDTSDYARFLFTLLHFQSSYFVSRPKDRVRMFVKRGSFGISEQTHDRILADRYVEVVAFALMPNHYHLLVREIEDGGISRYMQRMLNSYTKYFNARHEQVGHVFQGPFKAVHVATNEQLLHLSAYIHKNPKELSEWKDTEREYPWSSYQDYVDENRWGKLLVQNLILEQFERTDLYEHYVRTSVAKEERKAEAGV